MTTSRYNGLANEDEANPFDAMFREVDAEKPLARQPWSRADVYAYRQALVDLGFTPEQVENQIERDCGAEWCERPMLLVRQAS